MPNSSVAVTTSARAAESRAAASRVADAPGEADGRAGQAAQAPRSRARCRRRRSGRPQRVEGPDRDVDALVRHELGEHDVGVADRPRREAAGLDRRVQDGRVAAEVARDPPAGRLGVRDVARRRAAPRSSPTARQRWKITAERGAAERAAAGERLLARVPRVAERVVAVADVHRVLVGDARRAPTRSSSTARGRSRAGRATPSPTGTAAAACGTCARVGRSDCRKLVWTVRWAKRPSVPALVVDRREEVRVREQVAQREEHALGPAHVDAGSRARGRPALPPATSGPPSSPRGYLPGPA